jgi:hypothetical protein
MPRYLISFNEGAMTFPAEDLPAVGEAAHAVLREAKAAGAWVFGGGLFDAADASVVHTDGSVTDGPTPVVKDFLGGFAIVDVATREEALAWAAKLAVACRCDQEVRELMDDPEA